MQKIMKHLELFGDAQWLSPREECDGAFFRSVFNIEKKSKTEIIICGLGYFKLYINGKRVSDDEFVPAYSDYHDRPNMHLIYPIHDVRNFRIYCMKYDITEFVTEGENIIGISLGGGQYHQTMRKSEGTVSYGNIKVCYRIDTDEQTFLSDYKETLYSKGCFVQSNLYYGEILDYTGFDRNWNNANSQTDDWITPYAVVAPVSDYCIQDCPTDKVIETLTPVLIKNFGDYSVYGIEKNITGYPVVRCTKSEEKVALECAEEIFDDGNIDNLSVGWRKQNQNEIFITDNEEIYHPEFTWFGFRYFSLTNNAEPVEVRVIHSDVDITSDFECSNETLNWFNKTFINTQLSNMHGSVPSDCPHRERLGYTGDGMLTCDAVMTELDSKKFYKKWLTDIYDCQDQFTGHVQHTAPFAGGGGGPAGWGGAIVVVPYTYYRHYGDKAELELAFGKMDKYVDYMESRSDNGLVVREEKQGWCLGDWCAPEKIAIPEEYVNTTLYIAQLKIMKKCAAILELDSSKYDRAIKEHSDAVVKKYLDKKSGDFLCDIQGANAFAVYCGIAEEKTIDNIVKKYSENSEFDTGIFGTKILLNVLYSSGNGDLATRLFANKNTVSFEYMRNHGATTLWENWNGEASHSHPMFGASAVFLFSEILGIKQTETSVCYDSVVISPCFADSLDYAKGHITTPHGVISVDWKKEKDSANVVVNLCDGIDAVFEYGGYIQHLSAGENRINIINL